jgi:hypothetical protein
VSDRRASPDGNGRTVAIGGNWGLLLGPSVWEWAPAGDPRWSRNVLDVVEACAAALENVGALRIAEEEGRMHAVLAEIYRDHDAIICPTLATTGYPADATAAESVELAEGVQFRPEIAAEFGRRAGFLSSTGGGPVSCRVGTAPLEGVSCFPRRLPAARPTPAAGAVRSGRR